MGEQSREGLQLLGFPVEGTNGLLRRREGPIDAALLHVLERERQFPIDDALRYEGDLLPLKACL